MTLALCRPGALLYLGAAFRTKRHAQLHARFEQFAEHFLRHTPNATGRREPTAHKSNVDRWLLLVLAKKSLESITREGISAVLDRIPSERPALPRNVFVLMRTMLNCAVQRRELDKSPILGIKTPRSAQERHHILADDELLALAAYVPKLRPCGEI